MSQYNRLPQTSSTTKINLNDEEDLLDYSLHNIPSNFDLALNGGTNRTFNQTKVANTSLLDPEAFRRLSISTISSRPRSISPYPHCPSNHDHPSQPRTWKSALSDFWQQNQGLFLVTFSQLFGALMNVTTRLLELEGEGMHPFQILFVRQGLTVLLCTAWMWWTKVEDFPLGKKEVRGLLVVRSVTGFFGIYGMYYSLQYLPVADAVVITFLAPSVASYGCYLFLKEPFPRFAQYASLISLLGVVMIARPTSFFSSSSTTTSTIIPRTNSTSSTMESSFPTPTSGERLSAVLVAMIGVLGSAGAFTSIRWIGSRAHPLLSVNYFSLYCTILSTLALLTLSPLGISPDLHFALPSTSRQWSFLIFLGICGFVMQYLLTKGLAQGGRNGGARVQNMIYTNMLFALGLDRVVFGVSPGWWSLGGSGLILGSAVWVAVRKQKGEGEWEGDGGRDEERLVNGRGGVEEEEMAMLSGGQLRDEEEGEDEEMQLLGNGGAEEELREEAKDEHETGARLRREDEADGIVGSS